MKPTGTPSASGLQTPMTCPGAHSLTQVGFAHGAGDEGHDLHALLSAALDERKRGDAAQAAARVTEEQRDWLDAVLECVGDRLDNAAQEVAYSYDPRTGTALLHGAHLGRNYPEKLSVAEIQGTADYIAPFSDGSGWLVVDLKTGLAEMPTASRLWQLRVLALAVADWHGAARVTTAVLHAPRDGRRPWWEWGPTYDALELVALRSELLRGVERILYAQQQVARGETPRLVQGPHCGQCPAWRACPAQTSLVHQWAGRPEEAKRDLEQLLDVETAGLAWARVQAAKAVFAEVERQLYAFASVQPVPLSDGRVLGKHRSRGRDVVDAERAWTWLVERYGVDVAREAMTLKTSKTAIRDAVGARAPRGHKRAVGDAAVRELEAAGVIAERWTEDVGPYDPTDAETQSVKPALPDVAAELPPTRAAPVFSEAPGNDEVTT